MNTITVARKERSRSAIKTRNDRAKRLHQLLSELRREANVLKRSDDPAVVELGDMLFDTIKQGAANLSFAMCYLSSIRLDRINGKKIQGVL